MQRQQENRRFRRTREFGPQTIKLAFKTGPTRTEEVEAKLYDFSEGGLGMDVPRAFASGDLVDIEGELKGKAYSMQLVAKARVVYCRRLDSKAYRIGVAFLEHSYRPVVAGAQ